MPLHRSINTLVLRLGCVALAAVVGGLASPAVHADGSETLGTPSIAIASGNGVATAGFGLADTGSDTSTISVPANAAVRQVLLYWDATPFNNNDQLVINDQLVFGQVIGGNPFPNARSYRVDITNLNLVGPGVTNLSVRSIAGVASGIDGAGVLVIYSEATGQAYGGRAFAVQSRVGGNQTRVVDTGDLPPQGGDLNPAPTESTRFGIVSARVIGSRTIGTGGVTQSTTSVANAGLVVSSIGIGADLIETQANASCTASGPVVSGSSRFSRLRIGSVDQAQSFEPNRVLLNIPGIIRIVANEQTVSGTGATRNILVNALHVSSPLLGLVLPIDVVIGSAEAEISCSGGTGSSYIEVRDGHDFAFAVLEGSSFPPSLARTEPQTFTFPASQTARTAQLDLFVSGATIDPVTGDTTRIDIRVDGNLVLSQSDLLNSSAGPQFDNLRLFVPIPAGATTVTVELVSTFENFTWITAALSLPNQPVGNLFSGQAIVAKANVKRFFIFAAGDTGALPSTGGSLDASVQTISQAAGGIILAGTTGKATTTGAGERSDSEASLQTLNLTAWGANISAQVISSEAHASCDANNNATVTGASSLANPQINGRPVTVTRGLTIPLPLGGSLVLDEQVVTQTAPNIASITVTALHLVIPAQLEEYRDKNLTALALATSHADIVCR